jgi:hypothetical protein
LASKKDVVLVLTAIVKVTEASKKDKLTMKIIVSKFRIGKTQVYDILKSKSDIKCDWLTGNGSMRTISKDSNKIKS